MGSSFTKIKKKNLEKRLDELNEEYAAVSAQIGRTLGDADILRLTRQAAHLEQEIKQLETDIFQLDPDRTETRSVDNKEHQQLLVNLANFLTQRFDQEELRTLCFDLNVEYDDLSADGRANKARELVKLLDRHGRIPELITLGKQLRPNVAWDKPD
jgi:uncharacterized protein YeeX (DUF496 family)